MINAACIKCFITLPVWWWLLWNVANAVCKPAEQSQEVQQ